MICSSSYKNQLDAIDKIRSLLRHLKDVKFYEEINRELPVFILLGAQSSGKSSVITRITKGRIKLPTAAGMCTRVVTEIQLRSDKESSSVTLEGPNTEDFEDLSIKENNEDICSAVSKCQDKALSLIPKGEVFATKHTIVIRVSAPDLPNITILDMPGFNLRSPEATEQVLKLAKDRVENYPGSLILHVMRADIDSETIVGSDFINKCDRTTITVLTYLDKEGCEEYLEKTVSNPSLTLYGVLGNFEGEQDEEEKKLESFCHLKGMGEIELGSNKLVERLVEEMSSLLESKFPNALSMLKTNLKSTQDELNSIPKIDSPHSILFKVISEIKLDVVNKEIKLEMENEIREIIERLCLDIKEYELNSENSSELKELNIQDLKEGDLFIWCPGHGRFENAKSYICTFIKKDFLHVIAFVDADSFEKNKNYRLPVQECFVVDNSIGMKDEIKGIISQERGLKNEAMVGNYSVIKHYAEKFSHFYSGVMDSYLNELENEAYGHYNSIIQSSNEGEVYEPIVNKISELFSELMEKKRSELVKTFSKIGRFNKGSIVNTTNNHYLTENYKGLLNKQKSLKDDDSQIKMIIAFLEAFIKVQKKFIQELLSKEIQLNLVVELEEEFLEVLDNSFDVLLGSMKKPEKMVKRKKILEDKKEKIEQAIKILRKVDSKRRY